MENKLLTSPNYCIVFIKKQYLLLLFLFLGFTIVKGQSWVKFESGHMDDIFVDTISNEFSGMNLTLDRTNSSSKIFLKKFNGEGVFIQSNTVNASRTHNVEKCSDGGYIFISPNYTFPNRLDTITKTDVNGNAQWTKTFSTVAIYQNKILEDNQNNYLYISQNSVISKISSLGNPIWTRTYSFFTALSITNSANGYLIAGYSGNNIVFAHTDLNGDTLQTKKYYIPNIEYTIAFIKTPDGGFLGSSAISFTDPITVYRVDKNADTLWSKKIDASPRSIYKDYFIATRSDGGYNNSILKININTGDINWIFKGAYDVNSVSALKDGGVIAVCSTYAISSTIETVLIRLDKDGKLNANFVKGRLSKEKNNNCSLDANEAVLSKTLIKVTPGPLYTFTDYLGNYEFLLDTGITYTISPQINDVNLWVNNCTPSYNVFFKNKGFDSLGKDFFLNPIACPDLEVNFFKSNIPRCFKGSQLLTCTNKGNTSAIDVKLSMEIPLAYSIISANLPFTKVNNKYTFQAGTINPGAKVDILINDSVSCDATLNERYYIRSIAQTSTICSNISMSVDTSIAVVWIVGSYDPNDKTVFPNKLNYSDYLNGKKEVNYLIRFQNTGIGSAENIKIIDTLPLELDLGTIRNITSDHSVNWKFLDDRKRIIQWTFGGIMLPSKNYDEAKSQGYVSFTIDLANGLSDGTFISNKAGIYFDFNSPIVTEASIVEINNTKLTEAYKAKYVSVLLDSPLTNSTLNDPSSIVVSASTFDPDQAITKVEFYNGTTLIGVDVSAPYNFTWINFPEGLLSIFAKAINSEGLTVNSSVAEVTVILSQTTGIVDASTHSPIIIKPNPFILSTTIVLENNEKAEFIGIYDINGKLVKDLQSDSKNIVIGDELTTGVYTIVIVTGNKTYNKLIIKTP